MTEQIRHLKPPQESVLVSDAAPTPPEVVRRYESDRANIARDLVNKGILKETDIVEAPEKIG